MYSEAVQALSEQAAAKLAAQRRSLLSHFVRSMLAGMYVGAAIVLIFTIGGLLSREAPGAVRLLMGVCFGGALTIVIFAGSELFTGSNLVLTLGVWTGKCTLRDLRANWVWTWIGNLAGSVLLAYLVVRSGVLDVEPVRGFVLGLVEKKMNLAPEQLFWRAVLANWLVCLGVWMAVRIKDEAARVLMIWWCMFTFITCGFEHSIANMCGLMLGLLLHCDGLGITWTTDGITWVSGGITWAGYCYNLVLATLGNIVGGAGFVAGMYWLGSPTIRRAAAVKERGADAAGIPSGNGVGPVGVLAAGAPEPG
jgi:nitrite transporter NirC